MPLIEFHADPDLLGKIPEPYPASRAVPDWIKHLPVDQEGVPTIKRCAPFLQAITAGYIIPVPFDVQFWYLSEGELVFNSVGDLPQRHQPSQQAGTPFSASKIVKLINPWLIKTPPGYSTLYIRPFNRFDCPFVPLTGLVETDTLRSGFASLCLPDAFGQQLYPAAGRSARPSYPDSPRVVDFHRYDRRCSAAPENTPGPNGESTCVQGRPLGGRSSMGDSCGALARRNEAGQSRRRDAGVQEKGRRAGGP